MYAYGRALVRLGHDFDALRVGRPSALAGQHSFERAPIATASSSRSGSRVVRPAAIRPGPCPPVTQRFLRWFLLAHFITS